MLANVNIAKARKLTLGQQLSNYLHRVQRNDNFGSNFFLLLIINSLIIKKSDVLLTDASIPTLDQLCSSVLTT